MAKDLKTSIRIEADDRFSGVAKKIAAMGGKLGKQFERTQGELAKLSQRAGRVGQYGKLTAAIGKTGSEMRRAQARTAELGRRIAATAEPTKKLRAEFEKARRTSDRLGRQHREQRDRLRVLREELRGAGIDTRKLGDAQRRIARDIDAATSKLSEMETAADRVTAAQEKMARRTQTAANFSLAAGAVGRTGERLLGFVGDPVREAMAFESAMAGVRKVVDFENPGQFRAMSRDILELSKRIPLSAEGLAQIIEAAGQANVPREQLLRFAEDAARMSVAFDISAAESGTQMAYLREQFRLGQDGLVRLGDTFNHISNNMAARAPDLLNVARRVGSVGLAFGLTAEQVGALGAPILAKGIAPEMAGTAISALLNRLQTADLRDKKFREGLAAVGMTPEGLKQSIAQDAQGALMGFLEAVSGSRDSQGVLYRVVGEEHVKTISMLTEGMESYRRAVELAGNTEASAGSMMKEFESQASTAANSVALMENAARAAQVTIGTRLLPDVKNLAEKTSWAAGAADRMAEAFPGVTKWASRFTAMAGGLATVAAPALELSGTLLMGAAWWQLRAAKAQLAAAGRGAAGDIVAPGGGGRVQNAGWKVAEKAKGWGSKVRNVGSKFKGKFGVIGGALTALTIGSTLLDSGMSGSEKARDVTGSVGALGGGLAGAKLGALIGTAVFPGAGTAIGGIAGSILGGIAGGLGGDVLGENIGGLFDDATPPTGLATALAGAGATVDQGVHVEHLTINQQPGEDAQAMAERFLREAEQRQRIRSRGALHDEL